jgi:hypothetical protein
MRFSLILTYKAPQMPFGLPGEPQAGRYETSWFTHHRLIRVETLRSLNTTPCQAHPVIDLAE